MWIHSLVHSVINNLPRIPSYNSLLESFNKKNKQILNIYETANRNYNYGGRRLSELSDFVRLTFFDKCGRGNDDSSLSKKDNSSDVNVLTSLSGLKLRPLPINNI